MSQRWMDVPEHVTADPEASEVLRVWTVTEGQVFSVQVERWNDPAAWGMLLAEPRQTHCAQLRRVRRPDGTGGTPARDCRVSRGAPRWRRMSPGR